MPVTKEEARRVFRIVNSSLAGKIVFMPCEKEECLPLLLCGDYRPPGVYGRGRALPAVAWYDGGQIVVKIDSDSVRDPPKGFNDVAFLCGHEISHQTIFPVELFGTAVGARFCHRTSIHIIERMKGNDMGNANAFHMDYIVNEAMYRNKKFIDHLKRNGIDLFDGVRGAYHWSGKISSDDEIRVDPTRYNEMCILREQDPSRFASLRGANFNAIDKVVTEFLAADRKKWNADDYFSFLYRTVPVVRDVIRA